jgi:hypothetical protein
MITYQTLLPYVKAEPFRPFRIDMASGKFYDIRHPEMVKLGKTFLLVYFYVSDEPEILDRWDTASLMLIENISFLDSLVGKS